ncbi:hypothetical protein GY03_18015 [Proteus vulgaris]|uniref:hypothetical protein n=1 Tax=Proteus vulgaris TaxID=585 RepID=UPI0021B11AC2|nr:hypothetical protein [Proteus vulgaris]MCT6519176.1 hypothetical protein [Proteus vulgaris]
MLKQYSLWIGSVVLTLLLVGCDAKTPNCSSNETQALVQQIVQRELVKAYPKVSQDKLDSLKIELNAIRTQSHDAERDSYSCAADLTFSRLGQSNSTPITYTVQKIDNQQQFYVQVYGL